MPRVTVTKVDKSTKGKDRVYFDNLHNWQNAFYVGQDCGPPPAVGMVIEADTSSMRYQNAKADTWFLNRYSVAANGAAPPQATPQQTAAPAPLNIKTYTLTDPKPPGWPDLPTGDMLRWISNVVGSAIAANLIKTPSDIAQWVGASYRAAESLRKGDVPEFDSDVPRFTKEQISRIEPDAAEQQGGDEEEFEGDASIPF